MKRFEFLPREEVVKAVERRNPSRIPLVRSKWWGEGLEEQYGRRLAEFDAYPEDAVQFWIEPVKPGSMGLSWELRTGHGHDANAVIDDWEKLDEFIGKLPDPSKNTEIEGMAKAAEKARKEGRYVLFSWWRLFFERPWELRGMENLLMDYHTDPDRVHRLHSALCDLYCGYIDKAVRVLKPDGFWTSDDLGHQTNSMMSPEIFRTLIKPYYDRVGRRLGEHGLHWWLHSCGNNAPLMDMLIEAGVTVFHPVQKGTMDEKATAARYGGRITFLAGIDVQHVLQEKSPEEVRAEVRSLIDTFDRPEGGLCLAAGNGIVSGTPFENIKAFLEEALEYGEKHRKSYK